MKMKAETFADSAGFLILGLILRRYFEENQFRPVLIRMMKEPA